MRTGFSKLLKHGDIENDKCAGDIKTLNIDLVTNVSFYFWVDQYLLYMIGLHYINLIV